MDRGSMNRKAVVRRWSAIGVIVLGAAALVVPLVLWGVGALESGGISGSKDGIGAVSTYVTMTLVVLGAVASYFRFFYGRTLVERAKLKLEVDVFPDDSEHNLHSARLVVENAGTQRLRFHWIRLKSFSSFSVPTVCTAGEPVGEPPFDEVGPIDIEHLYECDGKHFIDSGETMDFLFPVRVPKTVPFVIHQARFVSSLDWKTEVLVKNEPTQAPKKTKTPDDTG
jgi:hypothetical protein